MSQKLHLHQLIKSLSVSEKGYFKKYYTKYGGQQSYLLLFDAIDNQTDYDEEDLKTQFANKKFTKQFSVAKNYLINNILKSLRAYHAGNSRDTLINELMVDIEILYKKRLIDQCKKTIKKAKKIVEEREMFNRYSQLASWEIRVVNLEAYSEGISQKVRKIYDFSLEGLEKDKNLTIYRHLAYHLFNESLKKGETRLEDQAKYGEDLLKDPLLQSEDQALSITAKGIFYNIMSKIGEMRYDYEQSYEASHKFVKLIQSNPKIFEENLSNHIIPAYYNLLITCVSLNRKETFFEQLEHFSKVPENYSTSNEVIARIVALLCGNAELRYYVQNRHFDEAVKIIPRLAQLLDRSKNIGFLSVHVQILYDIAYAYFGTGDYSQSIDWQNELIQRQYIELREDLLCYTWLLHLASHFELKNFKYLNYKLRTTYSYLLRSKKTHQFETTTLDFIKQLLKAPSERDYKKVFSEFRGKFAAFADDPFEQAAFKNFDVLTWLDSKLQNKSFSEMVYKK